MKRGTSILPLLVIVGLVACSFMANYVYSRKVEVAPYEAKAPTQFYAGMDKFASNLSWMTLVQWQAGGNMDPVRAESLYRKLNALTNLDPLFADAYLNGAMAMAAFRPDLSQALLDKAILMGLDDNWKVGDYAGFVQLQFLNNPRKAETYLFWAKGKRDAPPFVESMWMRARTRQIDGDPIAAMELWHTYYLQLKPDQSPQRKTAASEIRDLGQGFVTDCDAKLQSLTDAGGREALLNKKAKAEQMMDDVKHVFDLPTTRRTVTRGAARGQVLGA